MAVGGRAGGVVHSGLDAVFRDHDDAGGVVPPVPLQQVDKSDPLALGHRQGTHPDRFAVLGQDQAPGPSRCGRPPAPSR